MLKTVDLTNTLHIFQARLSGFILLLNDESATFRVSSILSYKTLVFKIERNESLYVQATFQYDEKTSSLTDLYSKDSNVEALLAPHFKSIISSTPEHLIATENYEPLSEGVSIYLKIAESIAKQAYLCTSGDDYSPGYFSKIVLNAEGVLLEQINYKNSRSLAHKEDYSLRDLTFFIPYDLQKLGKAGFEDEYIGAMRISFSDRSSANNRNCGDKIRLQIDAERMNFNASTIN